MVCVFFLLVYTCNNVECIKRPCQSKAPPFAPRFRQTALADSGKVYDQFKIIESHWYTGDRLWHPMKRTPWCQCSCSYSSNLHPARSCTIDTRLSVNSRSTTSIDTGPFETCEDGRSCQKLSSSDKEFWNVRYSLDLSRTTYLTFREDWCVILYCEPGLFIVWRWLAWRQLVQAHKLRWLCQGISSIQIVLLA